MNWHQITPSPFPWERAALDHVKALLPERHPYQAWSNFTFTSDRGHIREVDLLVAGPSGLHLVEIKSFRGRLSNRGSTWVLDDARRRAPFDSPLPLADQKAKELKGLLGDAARGEKFRLPFVRGSIFLSDRGMRCDLEPGQRHHLYGPAGNAGGLPDIAELLLAPPHQQIDPQFFRRLDALLRKVGIHRTQKSISIGPWRIEPQPYESGPTWQDHHARRPDDDVLYRRARIYLYERQEDDEARESVRLAAQREFAAGQGIQHPGLLIPTELADHEMGPALLIAQSPEAQRLDHWLVEHGAGLDLPARLGLVRQLAEAVRYAHDRRLVHRALAPRAIVVEADEDGPRLRIGEWQAAARGLSSSTTRHRVKATRHAGRHVESAAEPYLAPEFRDDADGTVAIDVFGLGAVAYLLLTGRAPATTQAELIERLAADGALHPAAVDDSLPDDVDALVALATDPLVRGRFETVEDFLAALAEIEDKQRASVHPEPDPDPYEAAAGDRLGQDYEVVRLLGTGATARALLVRHDHEEAVLKVGRDDGAAARLDDEAAVLADLAHDHVVRLRRGVFELGTTTIRTAIEVTLAGQENLARVLHRDGALLPDALQRFGGQLLDALAYLERHRVRHRDIKPDNIGVLTHPKRGTSVVLFDFSLAGVPDTDVTAGTNDYRDPFLGSPRRPVWDDAAERYGAAVTLHEMASRELPSWGDDGSDPRFAVGEVSLAEEVFDPALRDPLTRFFRRALAREADQRFDSAEAMRRAWEDAFVQVDEAAPARTTSWSDDPQQVRDDAADAAGLDTALDAAGLSPRAVAVAQRLGAATVGDLLAVATRRLWLARGLSKATRDELLQRTRDWRARLASEAERTATEEPRPDGAPPALDLLAEALLPAPVRRGVDQVAIVRRLLGLPGVDGTLPTLRWPPVTTVGAAVGLTGQRISQILGTQRERWRVDADLRAVRTELAAALHGLGRIATARELADQLLSTRGCARDAPADLRRAFAYAVLRAAIEGDDLDGPRFATRRHHDRMLIALQVADDEPTDTPSDAALLEMGVALGDRAVDLAGREPLPTPVAVVRELAAIATSFSSGLAEQRLVQLAASASGTVLSNARLELYPADLDPARALRLSQAGASIPDSGLGPEVFADRVAARFPGLAPLPDGAALARLLQEAGVAVRWDGEAVRPLTTLARSSSQLEPTSATVAGADPRLDRVVRDGGVRIVTARRSAWPSARARVAATTGATVRDAGAEFAVAVREVAAEHGVRSFTTVLRADAADAPARARTNLTKIVALAFERLEERWRAEPVLVLDGLTPFGRYDGAMAVLERLLAAAREAGRGGGPRTVVLLCVAADERTAPHVDDAAIGMVSGEEWLVATSAWLGGSDAA